MVKEPRVALGEEGKVVLADAALVSGGATPHPLDQRRGLCLQVDHQFRLGRLRADRVIDLLVQHELVRGERGAGKERILVNQEIGDHGPAEQVGLHERLELSDSLEQKKELRRQRIARHVLVEASQERVLPRLLQHRFGIEALGGHQESSRSMGCPAHSCRSSAALPRPGTMAPGSSSSSGISTNARSCMRGCGSVRSGVASVSVP